MPTEAEVVEGTTDLKVIDKRSQHPVHPPSESMSVVAIAMSKNYTPEQVEKMMELQIKFEKNEARKAFFEAVAAFKENPPEVCKDKENMQFSKGGKKAMYSSLGNFVKTVNPALGAHGLSASWEIEQADKLVKVSCKLSHRLGHSETVKMEAPPDASGGNAKNPIQQIKSTVTYLRAVTFEAVTGLAATDEANLDDDGNAAGGNEPTKYEQWQIKCDEAGAAAKTVAEIVKWWTDNEEAMKKEIKDLGAANIFVLIKAHKERLKKLQPNTEREPGQEG